MGGRVLYILECSDGKYYIGLAADLQRRLDEHNNKTHKNSFTSKRLPVKLVYQEYFSSIEDAIFNERKLKKWSHGKKKAMIENNIEELKRLSQRRTPRLSEASPP
jgi:putative endonuclease